MVDGPVEILTFDIRQPIPDGDAWSDDAIDSLIGQRIALAGFAIEGVEMGTIVKAWREYNLTEDDRQDVVMRIQPDNPEQVPSAADIISGL